MIPQDGPDSYACVGYRHIPCCDLSKPGHNSHVFDSCDHWTPPWCEACGAEWPCDAAVYMIRAEKAEMELAVVKRDVTALHRIIEDRQERGTEALIRAEKSEADLAVYEKKAERLAAELADRDALIKDHLAKIMHLENRIE